jgi:hypothetical protein
MSTAAWLAGPLVAVLLASLAPVGPGPGGGRDLTLGSSARAGQPAASVRPEGPSAQPGPLQAWLSGPFGRVAGEDHVPGTVPGGDTAHGTLSGEDPAPSRAPAPSGSSGATDVPPALDTYVRRAPLRLDLGDPELAMEQVTVTAGWTSAPEARELVLGRRGPAGPPFVMLEMTGPDEPGDHLVTADVLATDGRATVRHWLLHVPDRSAPPDGIIDVPAPLVVLEAAGTGVAGRPGNGCYVYTCVETGRLPPPGSLPALSVEAGMPVTLRLEDRSAVASWSASLVSNTGGEPLELGETYPEPRTSATFSAPEPGTWLVGALVLFDRERGWFEAFFRLDVERRSLRRSRRPRCRGPARRGTSALPRAASRP